VKRPWFLLNILLIADLTETLDLAELRLEEDQTAMLDDAWQDMFNYSTIR
jgi:hypothetical protein